MRWTRLAGAAMLAWTVGAASTLVATGQAGAVTSGTPAPSYDLAMGASLVTGTGSTGGADYVNDLYHDAQPVLPGLQLDNLGCGGETTTTMLNGGRCTKYATGSQLGDAEQLLNTGSVAFVTIDIGGDDVLGCAPGGTINETCFATGLAKIETNLPLILAGLRSASSTVPIVGLLYYDPFLEFWLNGPTGQQEARQSVTLAKQLDDALASIYQQYGVTVTSAFTSFHTSNFRGTGTWNGQTLPTNVATICNWTLMCTSGGTNVHTNNTGYAQLAAGFEKVLVVPPAISGTPPTATVGTPYSFQFDASGFPANHVSHLGTLPHGVRLSGTGLLAGTPTTAGTFQLTVSVSNIRVGTASEYVSFVVAAPG